MDNKNFDLEEHSIAKHMPRYSDVVDIYSLKKYSTSREIKKPVVEKKGSHLFLSSVFAASLVLGIFSGAVKGNSNVTSSTENITYTQDASNPYRPENLVFEQDVREAEGGSYKLVVTKYGECAYVDNNYQGPFQFLNGVYCKEAAEGFGFDFTSLNQSQENDIYSFTPDNIIFEHDISEIDGSEYKVVVTQDGKCAYVTKDYQNPFQFLNGVSSEDAALKFGFDFNSLSSSKTK